MTARAARDVLWSGGLDSTALIFHYLRRSHPVRAHYVRIEGNPNTGPELRAIEAIRPHLAGYDFNYMGELLTISVWYGWGELAMHQLPVWMLATAGLEGPVGLGYVLGDQAISYLADIQRLARAYSGLRRAPLRIETPLTKCGKSELYYALPEPVQSLVWWCEEDRVTPCSECASCRRMLAEVPGAMLAATVTAAAIRPSDTYREFERMVTQAQAKVHAGSGGPLVASYGMLDAIAAAESGEAIRGDQDTTTVPDDYVAPFECSGSNTRVC